MSCRLRDNTVVIFLIFVCKCKFYQYIEIIGLCRCVIPRDINCHSLELLDSDLVTKALVIQVQDEKYYCADYTKCKYC